MGTTSVQKNLQEMTKPFLSKYGTQDSSEGLERKFYCCNSTRYFVLLISVICCTLVFSNSLSLNFTIICMVNDRNGTTNNGPEAKNVYTASEQAWLFSAVAIGAFIGAVPLPFLNSKIGTRLIFSIYGFISAASTLFLPTAATIGYPILFLMRILQGIASAALFPATASIVNEWASGNEAGLFLAWITCYQQFAQITLMPVAGLFCGSKFGWQGIYYLHGSLTLAIFVVFFWFYRNYPSQHWCVSKRELSKINENKDSRSKDSTIPYHQIFSDKSIIGVWIASIGGFTAFQLFLQYGPTFLNKVLHINVEKTGIIGALPFCGALFVKFVAGPLSDHLTFLSNTRRCQMFGTISQFSMAICIAMLGWMPIKSTFFAQIAFTGAIMSSSLNVRGVIKSAQLQSRQYSHVTMTVIAFINSGIILLLPLIISVLAPNNTHSQWSVIFFSVAILVAGATIVFDCLSESEPRTWTYKHEKLNTSGVKEVA